MERAADILQLFVDSDAPDLGVTEIGRYLGLSKTVVHRLLASLRVKGFVILDEKTHRYRLGTASLLLGLAALERLDTRQLARPAMDELSAKTDETAILSIRSGDFRINVEQVVPAREVKMTVRIGHPVPLHAGAASKALLAFMEDHEIDEYLARQPLKRFTAATPTDRRLLRQEITEIRSTRCAYSQQEHELGVSAVATPMFDHEGRVLAVMSLCGPSDRFSSTADKATQQLLEAAQSVSAELGHQL